ncbi:hypothetical protein FI667_g8800, partial [Globisporangium splendens]
MTTRKRTLTTALDTSNNSSHTQQPSNNGNRHHSAASNRRHYSTASNPHNSDYSSVDDPHPSSSSWKSAKSAKSANDTIQNGNYGENSNSNNARAEYYERCQKLAAARVDDMVARYAKYRVEQSGRVDASRWKLLKQKPHLTCYRRIGKCANGHVPDLLAIGAVPGALEDVLHGVVNLSTEAMQIENAYAEGDLVDNRILATLVAPAANEPFRAVTIKWALRNHETLSRHRDYVYVESTGITTARDGEKIGYHLVHSIALPSAPAFTKDTNIVRGHVSCCFLYRQHRAHGVEVFYVGNTNPQGGTRERTALAIAVDSIMASASSSVQCAMMKKLAFSLRTKPPMPPPPQTRSRKNTLTALVMRSASVPQEEKAAACGVCRRQLRFFGRAPCELCTAVVCGRCRISKKLYVVDHGVFNPLKMEFCTECIVTTNTMSSAWVAAQELERVSVGDNTTVDSEDTSSQRSSSRDQFHIPQHTRLHKSHSVLSDGSVDDGERHTMVSELNAFSSSTTDRSSRVWLPSDRILRPTSDILASIRGPPALQPEEDDDQQPFFTEEEECPIIEMPSDDEDDDEDSVIVSGPTVRGVNKFNVAPPSHQVIDLLYLYKQ